MLSANTQHNSERFPVKSQTNNDVNHLSDTRLSLGREFQYDSTLLDSRPFPNQVSLSYQVIREKNSLQDSESCNQNDFRNNLIKEEQLNEEFWNKFKEYLKMTHREKSVVCRLSYAKKYYHVLLEDNAQSIVVYQTIRDYR